MSQAVVADRESHKGMLRLAWRLIEETKPRYMFLCHLMLIVITHLEYLKGYYLGIIVAQLQL